jgi:hypothetical protein
VVHVVYLSCCILVMFDVMTYLMICDIGLLYLCKVMTCLCMRKYMYACFGGSSDGEADKIRIFFKKKSYVHRLYSSIDVGI